MEEKEVYAFTSVLEESTNRLWGCHFAVPDVMAQALLAKGDKRVVCTLNEVHTYQCALTPVGEGRWVITVNKNIQQKYRLKYGDVVRATLCRDDSDYGLPMPEELVELMAQDATGKALFDALTPGKQRTLLYVIGKPKQVDKRVGLALVIIQHLKDQGGKIDFKRLNEAIK